jgi:hypothetical protein
VSEIDSLPHRAYLERIKGRAYSSPFLLLAWFPVAERLADSAAQLMLLLQLSSHPAPPATAGGSDFKSHRTARYRS